MWCRVVRHSGPSMATPRGGEQEKVGPGRTTLVQVVVVGDPGVLAVRESQVQLTAVRVVPRRFLRVKNSDLSAAECRVAGLAGPSVASPRGADDRVGAGKPVAQGPGLLML